MVKSTEHDLKDNRELPTLSTLPLFTLTFSLERSKLMLTIEDPLCHCNYLETVMQAWDREINP